MNVYTVPPGVIGLQGTTATWARLARTNPMPPTWTLVDGDMEVHFFRYGDAVLDDLTAASLGIVVLRPGATVPVKDDFTVPVPVAPDPRRRRGRSARRQRPRPR